MLADARSGTTRGLHRDSGSGGLSGYGSGNPCEAKPFGASLSSGYGTPPGERPCLTLEKLQRVGTAPFTKSELTAQLGEVVHYEIVADNTGDTSLMLSHFTDTGCTNIAGGAGTLAPGASTTWTCEHKLTEGGRYSNVATLEVSEGSGKRQCAKKRHCADRSHCSGKRHCSGRRHRFDNKHHHGQKESNTVTVNVGALTSGLTIEKLQRIGGAAFTTSELTAKVGETVDYEIIVKNTGETSLALSNFTDAGCTNIAGGASTLATGASTTWTCEHKLTEGGKYANVASVEANEGVGKKESNTVTVAAEVPPGSCDPSSSLAVLTIGKEVLSYVPQGNWGGGPTGVAVVNIEGGTSKPTAVSTPNTVNSCASNSQTGVTVCTANDTDVYILKGTTLTHTLHSGGSGTIGFSGGSCTTCGVAMDSVHNRALLTVSINGTPGFQFLNLETLTFEAPFPAASGEVSEDPLLDPTRELILSPAENDVYELVNVTKSAEPSFFQNGPIAATGEFDSAGEDCSTGIALASVEGSSPSQLYLSDLTQAKFTPGSPAGTWTASAQLETLEESFLAAGSSGVAVAQGTHTGVVNGEFGGDSITAISLPESSGSGTPKLRDYVSCEIGNGFAQGFDPHVVTAYQSPNGGDAIGLFGNGNALVVAQVDLTKLLNPAIVPRTAGGHACESKTLPAGVVSFTTLSAAPEFTADSPPENAKVGSPYTYAFVAAGIPKPEFGVASGALPPGILLNEMTGELTGEPTEAATFTFTIRAHNGVSPEALTPTLTIKVAP
jgi:hypothetical protein